MTDTRYNISQILQSPGNAPVLVSWGNRVSPIGSASSVASILDQEDRDDDRPVEVNLLGILVSAARVPDDSLDLRTLLDDIIVTAQQCKEALADEHEGRVRATMEHLVADTITVHNLVKNW